MKKYYGFLKPWEVSRYLGIEVEEVRTMIENGELPSTTIDGQVRVPWDKLEAWLDEEVNESELAELSQHLKDVTPKDVKAFVQSNEGKKKNTRKHH